MPSSPRTLDRIKRAQAVPTVQVGGQTFRRLIFGTSEGGFKCRACGVNYGLLHIVNCVAERCPRCRIGRLLTCACAAQQPPDLEQTT